MNASSIRVFEHIMKHDTFTSPNFIETSSVGMTLVEIVEDILSRKTFFDESCDPIVLKVCFPSAATVVCPFVDVDKSSKVVSWASETILSSSLKPRKKKEMKYYY